jgi:hypothetical protein
VEENMPLPSPGQEFRGANSETGLMAGLFIKKERKQNETQFQFL